MAATGLAVGAVFGLLGRHVPVGQKVCLALPADIRALWRIVSTTAAPTAPGPRGDGRSASRRLP